MRTSGSLEITDDKYRIQSKYFVCDDCGWLYVLVSENAAGICPRCYRSELTTISENDLQDFQQKPIEQVLPFQLNNVELTSLINKFTENIPFAPKDLTSCKLLGRIVKIYFPMWMVDAHLKAKWWAETGFNYGVISHKTRYDDKNREWVSKEVQEGRIRWEPRLGTLDREFHNVVAPALEEQGLIDTRLGRYQFNVNKTQIVEKLDEVYICLPNRKQPDAWPDAASTLLKLASEDCMRASKADHIRAFRWEPDFVNKNWTQILLPIYSTYYSDENGNNLPVMIHGQSGKIFGTRQASMKRARGITLILCLFAAGIFLLSTLLFVGSITFPILLAFSIIGFVFLLFVSLAAFFPLLIAWNFNRKNSPHMERIVI
jgi:hypothetical protein